LRNLRRQERKFPMLTIVYSIAPLVLIIIAGVLSGRTGLVSPTFRKGLSDFCFYFGMPALLVRTIATAPPSSTAAHLIWAAYLLPAGLVWIAATVFARDEGARTREASFIAMASVPHSRAVSRRAIKPDASWNRVKRMGGANGNCRRRLEESPHIGVRHHAGANADCWQVDR